jgi:DNA-binding PadR family transcriptional regulator
VATIRLTYSTGIVLQAVAAGYQYGFDIMDASGLPDGTVYPALRRLERAAWLESDWEDGEIAHAENRPPRRYYQLTAVGHQRLREARLRFPGLVRTVSDRPADLPQ